MIYARYAHLEELPSFVFGDTIERGTVIGAMGNTGQSTGPHLHFDLVDVYPGFVYRLKDIPKLIKRPVDELMMQYRYFIDEQLFACPYRVTTAFADLDYVIDGVWKLHLAYDVVPRYWTMRDIFYNRSKPAKVIDVGFDTGYGYYIVIGVDV